MATELSAAAEASAWSRERAARKGAKDAGFGAVSSGTGGIGVESSPRVKVPEGVAIVGQHKEAAEVLFRQLGKGYVEQLEELERDGALGSDTMRTMHETAETEVKMQCARAGVRIKDILQVVTDYMANVHGLVTGVAEKQRALFASAVESIVDEGPMRLHMLFTNIAKRDIQERMQKAEHGMDGSTFYRAAREAGVIDAEQTETEYWQQQIEEAREEARDEAKLEAEQANEELQEKLDAQIEKSDLLEAKVQNLVDAHDKQNAAAMNAYDLLVDELTHAEAQNQLESQLKTEEKKKTKRLEMLNKSQKDEIEQLTRRIQLLEEALERRQDVQQTAGRYYRSLKFTRTLLDDEGLRKSLDYQNRQEEQEEQAKEKLGIQQPPNSQGLDAFLRLNTATKVVRMIQRNYRRRKHMREQELLLKVCLQLQRWARGNIARKQLAARAAAKISERIEKRDAMLAKLRDQISGDDTVQGPFLGVRRAAMNARNRLAMRSARSNEVVEEGSEHGTQSDVATPNSATNEKCATDDVSNSTQGDTDSDEAEQQSENQSREDQAGSSTKTKEVAHEAVAPPCSFGRPCGGGVEEALWWREAAQAIRDLQDQVRSDSEQYNVRRADLRAKQESLRACHKRGKSQAATLAETAEQIQALAKDMAKRSMGGKDPAIERQRRILQQSLLKARKVYKHTIQDTQVMQDAVTIATKIHETNTRAEAQRLSWLRQLSSLTANDFDGNFFGPQEHEEVANDDEATNVQPSTDDANRRMQADTDMQEDRPQPKEKRARSIRFSPLEIHTEEDTVVQVLREGAHIRPLSVNDVHSGHTSKSHENVQSLTTGGTIQVDLTGLLTGNVPHRMLTEAADNAGAIRSTPEDNHDAFPTDKRSGILKGTSEQSRGTKQIRMRRPVSASSSVVPYTTKRCNDDAHAMQRPTSAGPLSGSATSSRSTHSHEILAASRRPMTERPHSAGVMSISNSINTSARVISTDTIGAKKRPRSAGTVTPKRLAAYSTPGFKYSAGTAYGAYQADVCASPCERWLVARTSASERSRSPLANPRTDVIGVNTAKIAVKGRRTALRPHPPRRELQGSGACTVR